VQAGALIERIIQFIVDQGALGVFVASILEEVIVPIPSTIIQTGAGFLFLAGEPITGYSLWILFSRIVVPSALGATIGSLALYGLVYWGGMPAIRRFGKYFFLSEAKVQKAHDAVLSRKSLVWAFCILRFLPILPTAFITAGAGLIRLPLRIYLITTFIGIFIRATYLGAAGWLTAGVFHSLAPNGSVVGMMASIAIALLVLTLSIVGIVWYRRKRAPISNDRR